MVSVDSKVYSSSFIDLNIIYIKRFSKQKSFINNVSPYSRTYVLHQQINSLVSVLTFVHTSAGITYIFWCVENIIFNFSQMENHGI